ncbi:MAG: PRC-barrel domain-containing protein [Ignavibacteriaceae bacterium]
MLRSVKELEGYKISAKDDEIGKVHDFFFDKQTWTIRYVVVDTGTWLTGRRVLLSPDSVGKPDWDAKIFPVNLTKKQIEESPDIDEHKPFERQKELELTMYYGWPAYWSGYAGPAGGGVPPAAAVPGSAARDKRQEMDMGTVEPDLHSAQSIINYNIHGTDDSIGHVEDFILDDSNWSIRYLIVDTHNWLPGGKKVILSPHWIKKMDWADSSVYIDLTKEQIKNSPEWDASKPLERSYEEVLHKYYGKNIYW